MTAATGMRSIVKSHVPSALLMMRYELTIETARAGMTTRISGTLYGVSYTVMDGHRMRITTRHWSFLLSSESRDFKI
jgi:hypothetical protein